MREYSSNSIKAIPRDLVGSDFSVRRRMEEGLRGAKWVWRSAVVVVKGRLPFEEGREVLVSFELSGGGSGEWQWIYR